MRAFRPLAALLASLLTLGLVASAAVAATVTVTNGTQFRDTGGAPVHAHGGGVLKVGSYYYWFGEDRNADDSFRYVSVYRSTDLATWEFRNHVLTEASAPELDSGNIERPKVIYNASTGRFVMWMHKEQAGNYSEARVAVASSPASAISMMWPDLLSARGFAALVLMSAWRPFQNSSPLTPRLSDLVQGM